MPQMMANAMPAAAMSMMHGGSRNMYKYPPMTMHNAGPPPAPPQQQQQHIYQQTVQMPPPAVNAQPVLAGYCNVM